MLTLSRSFTLNLHRERRRKKKVFWIGIVKIKPKDNSLHGLCVFLRSSETKSVNQTNRFKMILFLPGFFFLTWFIKFKLGVWNINHEWSYKICFVEGNKLYTMREISGYGLPRKTSWNLIQLYTKNWLIRIGGTKEKVENPTDSSR